jgi:diguanylate cyclase (GGDEF)-like protein
VVTDLVMPDMNGLDLLSRVKQRDPAIEVIMVTGHANMETAISALKAGARDYLVKPINHDEFKHTVALCIEQRRLLDENIELKALVNLYQVSQTIANCIDLERLNALILDNVAREVGVSRGIACFQEEDELLFKESRGLGDDVARLLMDVILRHYPWQEGKPGGFIMLNNFLPTAEQRGGAETIDLKDALLLFIKSRSAFLGVVILFNDAAKPFPAEINYRNLGFLLDQSSLALENAHRYARAKELLNIDELTGLYNYRFLDIALEHEIRRTERFGSGFSVVFLDIDLLKQINDTHGHLVGSKILKEMGVLLKRSVREIDVLIRYGGDEFTIILVETSQEGTAAVSERIRRTVAENVFLANEGYNLRVTVSLGYACFPFDTKSKQELLEMADQAMYHSKFCGKNRVFHISSLTQAEENPN